MFYLSKQDNSKSRRRILPRDAMRKRGVCCRPVSVRPSLWWIVAEDIVKLLVLPGSFITLVF